MKLTLKKILPMVLGMVAMSLSLSLSAHPVNSFNVVNQNNQYLEVPEIGGSGVGFLSQQQEKLIGEKVLREVRLHLPVLNDLWIEEEISQLFKHIYSQTNLGQPLAVVVVRDAQINAFAVPGGLFAINTGLLTSSKNMDEVAGVVAHEIAHVTQRHYSRSREAFKGQGLLSLAGLLAGIIVASQVPDAGAAVMLGSQAFLMDQQLIYSRNQEREADRVGMQYMSIAGYNPMSMADFFETMHRTTSQISFLPDFWLTHPLSSERMSEARLRARQYPPIKNNDVNKQELFELIRWRAAVLSGVASTAQLKTLAPRNPAVALALATYYINQSELTEAKQLLDTIQPSDVQKTLFLLVLSDWHKAKQQYQQALDVLLSYYRIAPENRVFALKVADIYIHLKQPDEAFKILTPLSQRFANDTSVWSLMQQAEALRTTPYTAINVLRYKSETQYWQGKEEDAIKGMLHAQRLAQEKNNQFLQETIGARLRQMQETRQLKL